MQEKHTAAVIILAAGSIKNKYHSYSFIYNSPALVPIASRSTVSFTIDFYRERNVKIYIAVNNDDEDLLKKELVYYPGITIIPIAESSGVNDSLAQAVQKVDEEDITVNVVTSIPTSFADMGEALIDNQLSNNNYYSGIVPFGKEVSFKFKKDNTPADFYAFTGIFRTKKEMLQSAIANLGYQTDLLEVVTQLTLLTDINFRQSEWIDTGHEINYADARKKLLSSRTFNAITIDNHVGILTKRSQHREKLANEAKYVGMLPIELQILYPRILPANIDQGEVMMEYYGYPNLSEYQLYRDIEPLQWKKIFSSLEYALTRMENYKFSIGRQAFIDFYYNKTINRIEEYYQSLDEKDDFRTYRELVINGLVCNNFSQMKPVLLKRIESMYNENDFCIMHGDFCFNNILYDTFSGTIKLIDPRGSFGDNCIGIYGDKKYDFAKLFHSSVGKYDYIVNNLFLYQQTEGRVTYQFPLRGNQLILESLSRELLQHTDMKEEDVMFIVGLLFLSMCPMHKDAPGRQRLMYAHGLYYINKYL